MSKPRLIDAIEFEDTLYLRNDIVNIKHCCCGYIETKGRICAISYDRVVLDVSEKFKFKEREIEFKDITKIDLVEEEGDKDDIFF